LSSGKALCGLYVPIPATNSARDKLKAEELKFLKLFKPRGEVKTTSEPGFFKEKLWHE